MIAPSGEPQSGEPQSGEPGSGEPRSGEPRSGEPPRSGLRNPAAAVRGVGAGALGALALALLLAVAPLAKVGGPHRGYAIGLVLGLAVITVVLLGMLGRPWAWRAAWVVPLGLVAGGWLHWSLGVLGLLFALLWAYVLRVRRTVLSGGVSGGAPSE